MSVPGVIPSTCGIAVVPGGSLPQELGTARISIKKSLLVLLVATVLVVRLSRLLAF